MSPRIRRAPCGTAAHVPPGCGALTVIGSSLRRSPPPRRSRCDPTRRSSAPHGSGLLEALDLRDRRAGEVETITAAALFVMIGAEPRTDWLRGVVALDPRGYVLTGTDVPIAV